MDETRQLAYSRIGNADSDTTLVFLHGSTMTKEGMLPLAQQFGDYNCVMYDLTGHGESAGEEPAEIWQFAEAVEESLLRMQREGLVTDRIILSGYSMGGAITCELAYRKRVRLAGIVILSSGADLKDYTPMVDDLKKMPAEQFRTDEIFPYLFGENTDTPQVDRERIMRQFSQTKVADTVGYGDLMVSNRYVHWEACEEITIPALLIHGSDDRIVLPMAAVETWRRIRGSELLMIPYKGHAAIYEDMDLVRTKILSFIRHVNE
ncbi:MAG: alpha/beta hydrolase [Roseburia sp.]|nr:alpha/beta hydrolase [Roseburia sp.]